MTGKHPKIRIGAQVGDLLVEGELGTGSFGSVYLARDVILGRHVAVKVVGSSGPSPADTLLDEARLVAQLHHPHIVTLFGVLPLESGAGWLFEMEYVDGESLDDLLDREPRLAPDRTRRLARELLEALGVAHDWCIVHGDIKPANILLTRKGDVKLADFGTWSRRWAARGSTRAP